MWYSFEYLIALCPGSGGGGGGGRGGGGGGGGFVLGSTMHLHSQFSFGKESVNIFMNYLSHVVRSSMERHTCIVSGRTSFLQLI